MLPIPPQLYTRIAVLLVSSAVGTVGPFVLQNRPGLTWAFDKTQGRIVQRVVDRLPNPFDKQDATPGPVKYDDGVIVNGACLTPYDDLSAHGPLLNPNDYCRPHWWTAGPVRSFISAPFRLLDAMRRWR
jgi:hypothetical protein